ncbi:gremlin-2-like [Scleropages formosus]|uniref:Gremlin 2, DAN family BMP antagonist n=1 Tax=Scleropages formosus TaxID=113540 RepID=A0A0P7UX15_SCLFO|nr:gremlin-2 [Scleropages formosus]KPP66263.1 gremlin-2-like [Scleropages formosus]
MQWKKLVLSALLATALCAAAASRKSRPQGSIPSPYKRSNNTSERRARKQEVLASSQEALVVTERKYLRSDWCKTQPLRQTVAEEGCRSRTVLNRFCYGQCNSFYIPRHIRKEQEAFQSCAFCRPNKFTTLTVELDCPGLQPPFRHRKIQCVKQCRCISVHVGESGKP